MKKAIDYTNEIITDLEAREADCERNYNAFHKEWERLMAVSETLVNGGSTIISLELQNNTEQRVAAFQKMEELHEESTAIRAAITSIATA